MTQIYADFSTKPDKATFLTVFFLQQFACYDLMLT
jgi:hypothetical protein